MVKAALTGREPWGKEKPLSLPASDRAARSRAPGPAVWGKVMRERRTSTRQKSFLQGRIFYNNRRASVDCLVRDVSATGAKLVFSSVVAIPDVVELWLSNKEEARRVRVQWRRGDEIGVTFDD